MLENTQQQNKPLNQKKMNQTQTENDHPLVVVKQSKIHGNGLFAKTNIKAGEIIGEVKGKPTKKDGPYVLWMDNAKQGFEVSCILKYINHNQKANACYYDDLTVVALRDIRKGEEITHNYGEDWL
ncbi:SET domain-containing protein [Kaarinaea lacus]